MLRTACMAVGHALGLQCSDISARSLRAGGAMVLLCAKVDDNIIRLLGLWHSDTMLHYLHLQAQPLMRDFARKMLYGGEYSLIPGPTPPVPTQQLLPPF